MPIIVSNTVNLSTVMYKPFITLLVYVVCDATSCVALHDVCVSVCVYSGGCDKAVAGQKAEESEDW